ncbi:hypothetical protein PVAND_014554 [Polypedilum vanderplanki]|uniref:Uncharacterized protein n=1 Tax=Polypedilum vanderplanki TaxID=319348 RepID=A0A9J6BA92_POLVA|nr:hypothetical protein PVAND_014554 [Polypedilum vanderplanki]
MTPKPLEIPTKNFKNDNEPTVVISGMSGRFPKSQNIAEFKENLMNKVDMTEPCETRFKQLNELIPDRCGQTKNIEKFDSAFFNIPAEFANHLDPMCRTLLEHVYEAIIDAGVSPKSIRGTKTGVFVGCCFADCHEYSIREKSGKEVTGSLRTLIPNHVSYAFDFKGPSYVIDSACSSSGYAADVALKSIKSGECDAAILAGTNLVLGPALSMGFNKMGVLSKDGIGKSFDEEANGYCRADAIVALFLQKSTDAKRVYATFVHAKKNVDGYKKEGLPFPSKVMQVKLFEEFYQEIGMNPNDVDYIEAHSTGTKVGDLEEVPGLDSIFCSNRKSPLLIGSLKSNMGHSEAASTTSSIVKSLLIFENKKLFSNLHFNKPRSGIEAFEKGSIKVVDEMTDFKGSLIGINSFGVGGANVHLLLKSHEKEKINNGAINDKLERILLWSGRTKEAVEMIFDSVTKAPLDAEHIALLQHSQEQTIALNTFRGFAIFDPRISVDENSKCVHKEINNYLDGKRKIAFVYSGIGSQWPQMISDLMRIPTFAKSINKCHEILLSKNLNLKEILSSPNEAANVLHSYISIAAIQIALTDILTTIGVKADYILGHSVGELGCAYADNCLTDEEMILCAYSRGIATLETKTINGAMAAVGVGYNELKGRLIEGVEIACHNNSTSCTISGPRVKIEKFIQQLKAENCFVREVNSGGIAFHSSYIAPMGPKLQKLLESVIKNPKERSQKWISTSVPKEKFENEESRLSSAKYHTNNLLNPVLFEEALASLPEKCLTIEIAPCGLLQAILKRAVPNGLHFSLTKREHKENARFLMNSLGKIFTNGVDMSIQNLYPKINFPVSRGTSMISPLIKWDHSSNFKAFKMDELDVNELKVPIMMRDPNFEFLAGHKIEGKIIFPGTGYLYIACRLAAAHHKQKFEDFDIEMDDIRFHNACFLSYEKDVELMAVYHGGDGKFEIREGKTVMCTGYIRPSSSSKIRNYEVKDNSHIPEMNGDEFYKELRIRNYNYEKLFRNVVGAKIDGSQVRAKWENNWIAFFDNLGQLVLISKDARGSLVPIRIRKVVLSPRAFLEQLKTFENLSDHEKIATAFYDKDLDMVHCPGMEFRGFTFTSIPKLLYRGHHVMSCYKFISHFPTPVITAENAAKICVQLAMENSMILKISSIEIDESEELEENSGIFNEFMAKAIESVPIVTSDLIFLSNRNIENANFVTIEKLETLKTKKSADFLIRKGFENLETIEQHLAESAFVICRNSISANSPKNLPKNFSLTAILNLENEKIFLIQYHKNLQEIPTNVIKISSRDFQWLEQLKESIKEKPTIVYAQNEKNSGILGLVNCLRREPNCGNLRCVFIDDDSAPDFEIEKEFYKKQLEKGLAVNIYRNGQWGSYRHLTLQQPSMSKISPTEVSAFLNIQTRGDLSSLKWIQQPLKLKVDGKHEVVRIHYAALNFRDVMIATGRVGPEMFGDKRNDQLKILGFEFSGITITGRRVYGMAPYGCLSTHFSDERVILLDVPKEWSLEQAATIIGTYGTIAISLFMKCQIEKDKSILIHAGSGGVGLSALYVAFASGMEVFTTVSNEEKRQFLLDTFPKLKPENIGNSRDTTFEDMIMKRTNGRGVDYVLNSLSDDKLLASLRCVAKAGYFIEIGKSDIVRDNKINLACFANELTFISVNMVNCAFTEGRSFEDLKSFVKQGIKKKFIVPLKTTVFKPEQTEEAFRYLASGKHIGKVLIQLREGEKLTKELLPMEIIPAMCFNENHSYIIVGGLGGFGLELADWMILRGGKKIVLSSSRGISNNYQTYRMRLWETYNAQIKISTADVTTAAGCQQLINEASKLGPIGGIFNLAVKLNDALFENQTQTTFEQTLATKAIATKHLDKISRNFCPSLEFFVVFSSVSCGLGNAGQSNYGMANSIMERIIEQRHQDGLPAKAIQWGAIGDVGILADLNEEKEISGTLMQRISSCLESMDTLVQSSDPIVCSMVVAEKGKAISSKAAMIENILKLLGIKDISAYPADTKVSDFGMDSLLSVEFMQLFEREFNVQLSVDEMRSMTLEKLMSYSNGKIDGKKMKIVDGKVVEI